MKLRIQGNSLRLRLTQPEVHSISQLNAVMETMQVGVDNPALIYSLTTHSTDNSVKITFQDHEINVSVPSNVAVSWATTEQVSIEKRISVGEGQSLHILIEKDFQCLHREKSVEPDQFPNPTAK